MNNTKIINEIEQIRQSLIRAINSQFSELISNLEILDGDINVTTIERILPLASDPSAFHKEKPVALVIGDERIVAPSWKSIYLKLLTLCSQDPCFYGNYSVAS